MVAEQQPSRRTADRSHVELPLAADVEETHAERGRGTEAGEEQGRAADERVVQLRLAGERRGDEAAQGVHRRVTRDDQHDAREDEGERD